MQYNLYVLSASVYIIYRYVLGCVTEDTARLNNITNRSAEILLQGNHAKFVKFLGFLIHPNAELVLKGKAFSKS